jgi:4-hydroxybenzoate polyprenyltransferase
MWKTLIFWLKVSRPGLWFPTIWLYLLPIGGTDAHVNLSFWIGLFYVTFPLNFLVYAWNDLVDFELDQDNPRKDSFLFGARAKDKADLEKLFWPIVVTQVPFIAFFCYQDGVKMLGLFVLILFTNAIYNFPKIGLRSRPPFELFNQFAYILVVVLSIWVNDVSWLSWQAFVYLAIFTIQAHLIGEIMDIFADKKGGRVTTATLIGLLPTKYILIAIVSLESFILLYVFHEVFLGSAIGLFAIWLFLDAFFIYGKRFYTVFEMKLFGLGLNGSGFLTMIWVWYHGSLRQVYL